MSSSGRHPPKTRCTLVQTGVLNSASTRNCRNEDHITTTADHSLRQTLHLACQNLSRDRSNLVSMLHTGLQTMAVCRSSLFSRSSIWGSFLRTYVTVNAISIRSLDQVELHVSKGELSSTILTTSDISNTVFGSATELHIPAMSCGSYLRHASVLASVPTRSPRPKWPKGRLLWTAARSSKQPVVCVL